MGRRKKKKVMLTNKIFMLVYKIVLMVNRQVLLEYVYLVVAGHLNLILDEVGNKNC